MDAEKKTLILQHFAEGQPVIYPADSSYALGGNAFHPQTIESIFRLKNREKNKALPLLIEKDKLACYAKDLHPLAEKLANLLWPGLFTMVLPKAPNLPKGLGLAHSIALRNPINPLLHKLLRWNQAPLVGTSANLSNQAPLCHAEEVKKVFPGVLLLKEEENFTQTPSCLIDTTQTPFRLLRKGATNWSSLPLSKEEKALLPWIEEAEEKKDPKKMP